MKNQHDLAFHSDASSSPRTDPEILKRLEAYKKANIIDVAYYRRVIREAPERALDMLLYKDLQRHEADMQVIAKQLPLAKAFYKKQSPEVRKRIDQRLIDVDPYYSEKAFFDEVSREKSRQAMKSGKARVGGFSAFW